MTRGVSPATYERKMKRQEQVRQLSASGIPVKKQAEILGVTVATITSDRQELGICKKMRIKQEPEIEPDVNGYSPVVTRVEGFVLGMRALNARAHLANEMQRHEFNREWNKRTRIALNDLKEVTEGLLRLLEEGEAERIASDIRERDDIGMHYR